jgi:hypothetical protein
MLKSLAPLVQFAVPKNVSLGHHSACNAAERTLGVGKIAAPAGLLRLAENCRLARPVGEVEAVTVRFVSLLCAHADPADQV